jgi:hypothetical protein
MASDGDHLESSTNPLDCERLARVEANNNRLQALGLNSFLISLPPLVRPSNRTVRPKVSGDEYIPSASEGGEDSLGGISLASDCSLEGVQVEGTMVSPTTGEFGLV